MKRMVLFIFHVPGLKPLPLGGQLLALICVKKLIWIFT
jgi:hypothetical protein